MSDTILSGRWTVYYGVENRRKALKWTGGTAAPDQAKTIYLALQALFGELNQMDDGTPIKADTPTEYIIGIIDPGDKDPWFIDRESMEHIVGGSFKTAYWKRVQDSNVGIVKVQVTSNTIDEADIGYDITHGDGDSGTLLDIKDKGSGEAELWIRPDSFAAANNFDSTSGTLTCNGATATQASAATTGEMLWANIYALLLSTEDTHLYVYQGVRSGDTAPDAIVTGYKSTWNWWGDAPPLSNFDILLLVADQSSDLLDRSTFIDQGYATVFARQYSMTSTYYIVDLFAGGRNPIPLETGIDRDNQTAWRTVTLSSSTGNWNVGDEIEGQTSGARAKILDTSGSNPTITLRYYLIENTSVDFTNGETIDNNDDTGSGTSGTPADYGPALLTGLSITHGADDTFDVNEDGSTEPYSIVIDVSDEALADAYQWTKYGTRDGETGTSDTDGIEGEQYIGSDYRVVYTTLVGTVAEGDVVTQVTSLARGKVVAHHTTDKILVLRNSRGTFNNTNDIQVDGSNYVTGPTCTPVAPIKACPFGNFAGGVWFCAPGVVLENYLTAEVNNFQLVDDLGNPVEAPTKVDVSATNTRVKDKVSIYRKNAGGDIERDYYSIDTVTAIGDTTISVDPVIRTSEAGKTTGGVLFVLDASAQKEHRYRYTGWSGDDFTLYNKAADTAEAGTDTDTIVATGGFAGCLVGDIIYNSTRTAITYIKSITSDDEVEVAPPVTGQTTGDSFRVGACAEAYEVTNDTVYAPFINSHETSGTDASPGTEGVNVVYPGSDVPVRIRVRHANDSQYNIKPFETDGVITATGLTVATIRQPETITS